MINIINVLAVVELFKDFHVLLMICIIKVFPCVGLNTLISFLDKVVGVLVLLWTNVEYIPWVRRNVTKIP